MRYSAANSFLTPATRSNYPNILTHALSAIGCVGHWVGRKNIVKLAHIVHACGRSIIAGKTTTVIWHAPSTVSGFVGLFLLCLTD